MYKEVQVQLNCFLDTCVLIKWTPADMEIVVWDVSIDITNLFPNKSS